jgi:hypothetical protein
VLAGLEREDGPQLVGHGKADRLGLRGLGITSATVRV